tara:strand:- start:302 stop:694 length:393 start_codon:yes stop_codon:yes gene_type:complete
MELSMQRNSQMRDEMLTAIVGRRWARFQSVRWPSGETQAADLQSKGVTVDTRTVQGWRQGQLPSNKHKIQLIRAGLKPMLDRAYEPAEAAGKIAELEAQVEQQKAAAAAAERELALIRDALAGFSDDLEG